MSARDVVVDPAHGSAVQDSQTALGCCLYLCSLTRPEKGTDTGEGWNGTAVITAVVFGAHGLLRGCPEGRFSLRCDCGPSGLRRGSAEIFPRDTGCPFVVPLYYHPVTILSMVDNTPRLG